MRYYLVFSGLRPSIHGRRIAVYNIDELCAHRIMRDSSAIKPYLGPIDSVHIQVINPYADADNYMLEIYDASMILAVVTNRLNGSFVYLYGGR